MNLTDTNLNFFDGITKQEQFLALVILALSCTVCALWTAMMILVFQIKRLMDLVAAVSKGDSESPKSLLLSPQVKTKLSPKTKKILKFSESTSCAPPRDTDEEDL